MAIAKCIGHTKNSLGYGWNEEKDAVVVYRNNIMGEDPGEINQEFKLIQDQNYQCPNNTISVVLSLSSKNTVEVDDSKWEAIIDEYMREMKLKDHQAIAFKHQDKKHLHCHLYINRVRYDGKAYSSSYIGYKSGLVADKISEKHGLARPMQMKKEREKKTKDVRNEIYGIHSKVLKSLKQKNYENYIHAMATQNVTVKPVESKNGHLNGFRYYYQNQDFKASAIHRSMSLANLHRALYNSQDGWPEIKETQPMVSDHSNTVNNNYEFIRLLDHICKMLRKSQSIDNSADIENEDFRRRKKRKKRRGRGI